MLLGMLIFYITNAAGGESHHVKVRTTLFVSRIQVSSPFGFLWFYGKFWDRKPWSKEIQASNLAHVNFQKRYNVRHWLYC